jgi:carboxypeptidase Taq
MFLDQKFVDLINQSEKEKDLTDQEEGIRRVLLRSLNFYEKIPSDFLEKFENLTNTSTIIWRTAKEKNNFKLFEPSLSKIFEMNRQMAEYLGYVDSPYDALLDQYEEGLTVKIVKQLFSEVKIPLQELLGKIQSSPKYFKVHPLENAKYDKGKMMDANNKILKLLWGDSSRLRLDISAHPFTTSFSNNDTRITTWYHETDFARSVLATIHEFGHALYDLQCDPNLQMTPIQGGSSLVIHESQSRLWENFVGRSEPFINHFKKDFESAVGHSLSTDDLMFYFNKVSPSPLRVEADEVTYHFHIMLRFEIEKGLIEGKLKVKDLPEIWNIKMKEYLGIKPKDYSDGVLQDVHWSNGMVGYFPTYSLGTFLGAQWEQKLSNGRISKLASRKLDISEYVDIEKWLREHIHKYGSTYTLQDLLAKNKMKFDPKVNLKYLEEKYRKIYGF